MKKIDKLLLKSFIGPFVATFSIALFVLTMQYLWVYIDDIMGKGASLFLIIELISYLVVSLFPMALPLAVLISSVMIFGAMSEKYELASFMSAGVPLIRILLPLAFVASGISIFSFLCSNYIIPVTNLQFKSRLYDIRKQKPTLSLKEGIFNYDFKGYTIYIGKKEEDGKTIKDIIIYDDKNSSSQGLSQITAASGEMYMTPNDRYFIMNLYNGVRNQETTRNFKEGDKSYPFVRTKFKEHNMVFDLSQFDINETDKDLFKTHQSVMSIDQLGVAIDSLSTKIDKRYTQMRKNLYQNFYFEKKRDTVLFKVPRSASKKSIEKRKAAQDRRLKQIAKDNKTSRADSLKNERLKNRGTPKLRQIKQKIKRDSTEYQRFAEAFSKGDLPQIFTRAKSSARSILSSSNSSARSLEVLLEKRVKHIYIRHTKVSYAIICLIFLFIGGPMGAIVRKGGFGYPLLISVGFFVLFIVLTVACEKLAESHVFQASFAAWIPVLTLAPLGAYITYRAMGENSSINLNGITKLIDFLSKYFK